MTFLVHLFCYTSRDNVCLDDRMYTTFFLSCGQQAEELMNKIFSSPHWHCSLFFCEYLIETVSLAILISDKHIHTSNQLEYRIRYSISYSTIINIYIYTSNYYVHGIYTMHVKAYKLGRHMHGVACHTYVHDSISSKPSHI